MRLLTENVSHRVSNEVAHSRVVPSNDPSTRAVTYYFFQFPSEFFRFQTNPSGTPMDTIELYIGNAQEGCKLF